MLTAQQIADIAAYSAADKRMADAAYQASHQDATGLAPSITYSTLFEMRLIDILSARLPAQLLATPLVDPQYQDLADRMATNLGDPDVSAWTAQTPPVVRNFYLGDIEDSIKEDNFPCVVVSQSLPGGTDIQFNTIGMTQDNMATVYISYTLEYKPSVKRQLEASRGAEAIADILSQYRTDSPATCWQNGQVGSIQRVARRLGSSASARLIAGLVPFRAMRRAHTYNVGP